MAKKCLHLYKLKNIARKGNEPYYLYICTKPTCTHNIRPELVDGKLTECNRCGEPFIIQLEALRNRGSKSGWMIKPHCSDCTKPPNNPALRKKSEIRETIKELDVDSLLSDVIPKGL